MIGVNDNIKKNKKRPDFPEKNNIVPLETTAWFSLQYQVRDNRDGLFLSAIRDSKPEWYQPMEYRLPEKRPNKPEGWNVAPHLHLANLNITKQDEILEFVNRWGLLGLWKVEGEGWGFSGWPWPYVGGKPRMYQEGLFGDKEFSFWYINPYYENKKSGYYLHRYREPLDAFIMAAKRFQEFIRLLNGTPNNKSEAQDIANYYLLDCHPVAWYAAKPEESWKSHWQIPSLLHACYLLTLFDLCALRSYRVCKHKPCSRIYLAKRDNQLYCSDNCQNNAKQYRDYHSKKRSKK
jgi:hypothetical protein